MRSIEIDLSKEFLPQSVKCTVLWDNESFRERLLFREEKSSTPIGKISGYFEDLLRS
jgi:hypothetical protein